MFEKIKMLFARSASNVPWMTSATEAITLLVDKVEELEKKLADKPVKKAKDPTADETK